MILFDHTGKGEAYSMRNCIDDGFQAVTNISRKFPAIFNSRKIFNHIDDDDLWSSTSLMINGGNEVKTKILLSNGFSD